MAHNSGTNRAHPWQKGNFLTLGLFYREKLLVSLEGFFV